MREGMEMEDRAMTWIVDSFVSLVVKGERVSIP
jgi:hypothetical protein